ncbi:MAG TPA: hypothetical protein VE932_13850 [Patescibacteria group bacterium]|nr:hypothetical protein [Patescibacteria group bacterium]
MRSRRAQIHLPPLDAGYALTLVGIFERAIDAIWRAHGPAMSHLQSLRADAARPRPPAPPRHDDPDERLF